MKWKKKLKISQRLRSMTLLLLHRSRANPVKNFDTVDQAILPSCIFRLQFSLFKNRETYRTPIRPQNNQPGRLWNLWWYFLMSRNTGNYRCIYAYWNILFIIHNMYIYSYIRCMYMSNMIIYRYMYNISSYVYRQKKHRVISKPVPFPCCKNLVLHGVRLMQHLLDVRP